MATTPKLVEVPGSHREPLVGATRLGRAEPTERVEVTVLLRGPSGTAASVPDAAKSPRLSIEELEAKMNGLEPVVPMRQTFYGAAEIGFADSAGNIVIFSMQSGY